MTETYRLFRHIINWINELIVAAKFTLLISIAGVVVGGYFTNWGEELALNSSFLGFVLSFWFRIGTTATALFIAIAMAQFFDHATDESS